MAPRVFLLSPARIGGPRSFMLLRPAAEFDLAVRLREGTATIGEVYSFISRLYFRGKVAYAGAFASALETVPPALTIVPGTGLMSLETPVSGEQMRTIGNVSIERDYHVYRDTLLRDARSLEQAADPACRVVLLGSIATDKYTTPLLEVFGERLVFPADFVGRGDMSRGGLMLRSANTGVELTYIRVGSAMRRGPRPPKLKRLAKNKFAPLAKE
ncbi:MAG: hypothetical protein ABI833_00005 [Acidobacteriota bacterium]